MTQTSGQGQIPSREVSRSRLLAQVALGLGLAYLPTWTSPVSRLVGVDLPGQGPATVLWLNWVGVAALLAYVSLVERQPWASLLLTRPRPGDLQWAVLFWGAATTYSWVMTILRPPEPNAGFATITAMPVLAVAGLVVTTAVTEEILMRAYPIERLTVLTGRRWIGVVVSAGVFIAPHLLFFNPSWLLYQGASVIAVYVLYLWRRNLYARMLLHLLGNAPVLIPTVLT